MRRRKHQRGSDLLALFGAVAAVLALFSLLALGVWAHFEGPCSIYKYTKASDVPARCFMHR